MRQPADVTADEMPDPTPDRILIRVVAEAYIATAAPARARAFLTLATSILADEAAVAEVFPIKPLEKQGPATRARRDAVSAWKEILPVLMARLPPQ